MLVQRPTSVPGGHIFVRPCLLPSYFDAQARPKEGARESTARVKAVLDEESAGLSTVADHEAFANEVLQIKSELARREHILVLPWNLTDEISRELDYVQPPGAAGFRSLRQIV
jgi:hypothetical protein